MAQLLSPKARLWISGRKRQKKQRPLLLKRPIWMHCASLGEFEQGRPLLESIKKQYPDVPLLLTFFSPSGYEIRKSYPHVDDVRYLPLDTPAQMARFVKKIDPRS